MASELDDLRARAAEFTTTLGVEESLEVNAAILDLGPGDPVATNRLGIGLIKNARYDEAIAVLENGLRVTPDDTIMRQRLDQARKLQAKPPAPKKKGVSSKGTGHIGWTDFESADLVESALQGPGRDACIALCAASIRASEAIDGTWTAVTPIKVGRRFRVIGGIFTGVAPWNEYLSVAVPVEAKKLAARVRELGGDALEPAKAIPCHELIIPREHVAALAEELLAAHVEHLRYSLEFGPPTHLNKHHPGVRAYLLEQADAL